MKLALIMAAALAAAPAADNPITAYLTPQRLITLPDGRKINLVCTGEGEPTVILLGGLGVPTEAWSRAQPLIARSHRTCAFDQPGYRFSELGPLPLTAKRATKDLHDAMKAARFKPPYILVAHSRAGYDARLFAHRYPRETAGLVLLDVNSGLKPAGRPKPEPHDPCIVAAAAEQLKPGAPLFEACGSPAPGSPILNANMARATLSQADNLNSDNDAVAKIRSYGALPMVVLTAGSYPPKMKDGPAQQAAKEADHAALAAQSRKGRHRVIPGAGHVIMFDKPEAVAQAVEEVVSLR